MVTLRCVGILSLVCLLAVGSAVADEETLKFRLITTMATGTFFDAPNVQDRKMSAGQYVGVAVFEDGRLAFKQFVMTMDNAGSTGNYAGYSTYTFLDGDSLTLKFTGGWGPDGSGGDYEVLSGTGAYKDATGKGRFVKVKEAWDSANLFDVTITLKHAGN